VAVEKPAGVRIVTIHDANMAAAVQPAQKQLLNAWKDNEHSTFTGDLTDKVNRILSRTTAFLRKEEWEKKHIHGNSDPWVWISGDYKDATDLLRMECSRAALSALEGLGLMNYDLMKKSLDPLWVHYPSKESYRKANVHKPPEGEVKKQTGGQMMGHWLSFPLLCAINCATIRRSIKVWIRESKDIWQEEERRRCGQVIWKNFLVNGDDILFRCPLSFYRVWLAQVGKFGFKVSMGKNYKSPDFVMINSRYFKFNPLLNKMEELGYMNLRLIYGKMRSLDESGGVVTPDMIGSKVGDMIRLCEWSRECIPHAMRIARELYTGGWLEPNWFVPAHLGGNGLPPELSPGGRIGISREQRLVAAWMVQNPLHASLYCSKVGDIRNPKVLRLLEKFGDVFMLPSRKLEYLGDPVFVECERMFLGYELTMGRVPEIPEHFCVMSDFFEEREKFSISCKEQLDDWQAKALSISRAMQEKVKIEPPEKEVRPKILKTLESSGYLSPLSNEGFVRYWDPNWHCFAKPGVRPTSILKGITRFRRDQWRDRDGRLKECEGVADAFDRLQMHWDIGELQSGKGKPVEGESCPSMIKYNDRLDAWLQRNSFSEHWGEWEPVEGPSW